MGRRRLPAPASSVGRRRPRTRFELVSVVLSSRLMPTWSASTGAGSRPLGAAATTSAARPGTRARRCRRRCVRTSMPPARRAPPGRQPAGTRGRSRQAVRPVLDGVHRRHHGQQHLGRADVARGLLAADVLSRVCRASRYAGLPATSTLTPTSRPGSARSEPDRTAMKPACGPPKPMGTPNRCADPDRDVGAPHSPGGVQQGERKQIRRDGDDSAPGRAPLRPPRRSHGSPPTSPDRPAAHRTTHPRAARRRESRDPPTPSRVPRGSARVCTGAGLRAAVGVDDEHRSRRGLRLAPHQRHRLGCGRRFVEQRRVGDRQRGEVGDHGLEVQQRFEPPREISGW